MFSERTVEYAFEKYKYYYIFNLSVTYLNYACNNLFKNHSKGIRINIEFCSITIPSD